MLLASVLLFGISTASLLPQLPYYHTIDLDRNVKAPLTWQSSIGSHEKLQSYFADDLERLVSFKFGFQEESGIGLF